MLVAVILVIFEVLQVEAIPRSNLLDKNVSYTLDNLLLPAKYNKKVRPDIGELHDGCVFQTAVV